MFKRGDKGHGCLKTMYVLIVFEHPMIDTLVLHTSTVFRRVV